MMTKENIKEKLNKKYYFIISLFFILFSQQANLIIYITNYQRLGSNPFLVFLAIFLPVIGAGAIIFEYLYKNKLNSIVRNILKDYLPFAIMVFSFLVIFLGQLYEFPKVSGDSMNYSLVNGKRIAIEKYNLNIKSNDIVVAKPDNTKERIVKRVVATPGDIVYFEKVDGNYYIRVLKKNTLEYYEFKNYNKKDHAPKFTIKQIGAIKGLLKSHVAESDYLESIGKMDPIEHAYDKFSDKNKYNDLKSKFAFIVPQDKYLLIGDNYTNSRDSRTYGLFDYYKIVGRYIKWIT